MESVQIINTSTEGEVLHGFIMDSLGKAGSFSIGVGESQALALTGDSKVVFTHESQAQAFEPIEEQEEA